MCLSWDYKRLAIRSNNYKIPNNSRPVWSWFHEKFHYDNHGYYVEKQHPGYHLASTGTRFFQADFELIYEGRAA